MSYTGGLQQRKMAPRCMKHGCDAVANGGGCRACGYWFCKEHVYRHENCEEGR